MLKNLGSGVLFLLLLLSVTTSPLLAKEPVEFKNSQQHYVYDLSYKGISIGKIIRDISYYNNDLSVISRAQLSFLFYDVSGSQDSQLYWDISSEQIFAKKFSRISEGFGGGSLQAEFFDDGHRTRVVNDGEGSEYISETGRIIDFNGIGLQLIAGLKNGQTHFDYYMQTSDSVAHYFFEVKGKEILATKFGKISTFRVEQTQKDDRILVAWFAPAINYQMVKFHYKRKLVDIRGVLSEYSINKL